jgi:hypothetical protein
MVNKEEQLQPVPKKAGTRKRSIICWIILCMALTYFMILAILFLAGTIFSERIIEILSPYFEPGNKISSNFERFAITGSLLYFLSSAGIILFMFRRKAGFYIFFLATLAIFSLDLAFLAFDWMRYLILSGFIFLLGIAHFSKRCYY